MSRVLIVFLLFAVLSVYGQWLFNPFNFNPQPAASTAAPAAPAYVEVYKRQGYDGDDKGNVWYGNDNAKIFLIAKGSWP